MIKFLFLLIFCITPLLCKATPSNSVSDFNADRISDVPLISIEASGALSWKVYSPVTGEMLTEVASLGKSGDNITVANWYSSSQSSLAYVTKKSSSIRWYALRANGKLVSKKFGSTKDLVVSGGDFDGDGINDAAVVTTESDGTYLWDIKRDFFLTPGQRRKLLRKSSRSRASKLTKPDRMTVRFGKIGDVPFYLNVDGKGDWLAVIRKSKGVLNYSLIARNPYSRRSKRIALGSGPGGSLRPLPIKQAIGADLLAFTHRVGGNTDLSFIDTHGSQIASTTLPGTGEIIVGNFDGRPGFETAMQTSDGFLVYNPLTNDTSSLVLPSGIAIDEINITSFSGGNGGLIPISDIAAKCTTVHAINSKVLYKQGSGGTSDTRTGRPLFLWYSPEDDPGVPTLRVLASDGSEIAAFGRYPGGPLIRFYSGFNGGSYDSGSSLKSKANELTGNSTIYLLADGGNCWGPIADPTKRTGGK